MALESEYEICQTSERFTRHFGSVDALLSDTYRTLEIIIIIIGLSATKIKGVVKVLTYRSCDFFLQGPSRISILNGLFMVLFIHI